MLRSLDFPIQKILIVHEDDTRLCGAIMSIDREHSKLPVIVSNAEAAFDKELIWGETGPRLLTRVFGNSEIKITALKSETFYPLHFSIFWKAFLPEYKEECEELCRNAYTVHLWNSVVGHIGVWKRYMPPVGSYLHGRFTEDGTDRFFDGAYPENVMRQMIDNWSGRLSGSDLALRQVLLQVVPGLLRTVQRRTADMRLKFKKVE